MEKKQVVAIPVEQFNKLMQLVTALPYHAARPIVDIVDKSAMSLDVELEVKDGSAT